MSRVIIIIIIICVTAAISIIVLGFKRSKCNCGDVFTKPVGVNNFKEHYPTIMGWTIIPRVPSNIKTTEEDKLPCPRCSWGLTHENKQL